MMNHKLILVSTKSTQISNCRPTCISWIYIFSC